MQFYIHSESKKYLTKKIVKWGRINFSSYPWRYTENKYHALCAEIMLQRTNADQVVPVYNSFCNKFKTPQEYLNENMPPIFNSLGLIWRQREFNRLTQILSNTTIPINKIELLELPGIGNYISSAFRSLHLNKRDFIIDSNVVRIYGRFFGFLTHGETRRNRWFIDLAESITPIRNFKAYNYGIIDFTRSICTIKPNCDICTIKNKCNYYKAKNNRI